jgi:hypothetical protein
MQRRVRLGRPMARAAAAAMAIAAVSCPPALAQSSETAVVSPDPQTARFDGANGIDLPGQETLNLSDVSTIEFWVKPGWTSLAYDPVLISAIDDAKVRYAIFMAADRSGIGLRSGNDADLAEFDFSDGKSHHVALVNQGDLADVYIDGELADTITVAFDSSIDVRSFHIGSADGTASPFIGSLSEIRLWDTALDADDISAFNRLGILSEQGLAHPDIASLVGVSDFANSRRNFALVINSSTMRDLYEQLAVKRGMILPVTQAAGPVTGADGSTIEPLTAEEAALFFEPLEASEPAAGDTRGEAQ